MPNPAKDKQPGQGGDRAGGRKLPTTTAPGTREPGGLTWVPGGGGTRQPDVTLRPAHVLGKGVCLPGQLDPPPQAELALRALRCAVGRAAGGQQQGQVSKPSGGGSQRGQEPPRNQGAEGHEPPRETPFPSTETHRDAKPPPRSASGFFKLIFSTIHWCSGPPVTAELPHGRWHRPPLRTQHALHGQGCPGHPAEPAAVGGGSWHAGCSAGDPPVSRPLPPHCPGERRKGSATSESRRHLPSGQSLLTNQHSPTASRGQDSAGSRGSRRAGARQPAGDPSNPSQPDGEAAKCR